MPADKITFLFPNSQRHLIKENQSESVWPDKNRQMSIKVAQKWFH